MTHQGTAKPVTLALASLLALVACQPAPALPPPPKPAPPPPPRSTTSMAVDACESAVLAAFHESSAHRRHDLVLAPQQRKTVAGRNGQITVTGGGSYANEADKLVRVTYTCGYDVKTESVVRSSFR